VAISCKGAEIASLRSQRRDFLQYLQDLSISLRKKSATFSVYQFFLLFQDIPDAIIISNSSKGPPGLLASMAFGGIFFLTGSFGAGSQLLSGCNSFLVWR